MITIQIPDQIAPHRDLRAGRHVQRCLTDGAPDRLATEEARCSVPDTLGDEVLIRVGRRAVQVRRGLGDAGALNEHDGGDRERAGHDADREQAEVRRLRERKTLWDRRKVLDAGDTVQSREDHHQRGHDQRHERAA